MLLNGWQPTVFATIAIAIIGDAPKVSVAYTTGSVNMSCRGVVDGDGRPLGADRVRWELLRETDDRERLDRSCAAVGPAVIAAPLTSLAAAPAGLDDVTFVTWNVHADAGDLRAMVDSVRAGGPDRPARPHTVLFLQEVFRAGDQVPSSVPPGADVPRAVRTRGGPRDDVVAAVRALGLHLVYIPAMRNGRDAGPTGPEDRGNAIASTLPLSDITAIELPMSRHRRVTVAATIGGGSAAGDWRVRVASVHLDTVSRWPNLFLFSSHLRRRQAERLVGVLGDSTPIVIGADANSWSEGPAEPAVETLRRALPATPAPRWQPTFQGIWRLDYLFFRLPDPWRAASQRSHQTFGSDHHAVIGHLVGPTASKSAVEHPK